MKPAVILALCLAAATPLRGQNSTITGSAYTSWGNLYASAGATWPGDCVDVDSLGLMTMNVNSPDVECSSDYGYASASCTGEGVFVWSGAYTITASYSGFVGQYGYPGGDQCEVNGSSAQATVVVPRGPVIGVDVNPSASTVQAGQGLSIQVIVGGYGGAETNEPSPGGSVTLYSGGTQLARQTLGYDDYGDGVATFTENTKGIPPGNYNLGVNYSGDTNYLPSGGTASITIEAAQMTTATSLTVVPNPIVAGESTKVSVTVAPTGVTVPSGSATLLLNSSSVGTIALSNGSGAVTVPASVPAGTYSLVAVYGGDQFNLPSTSAAVQVQVLAQSPTTTTLAASPNPVVEGQGVALTATVTPQDGNGTPTGAVTLTANGQPLAKLALSHGTATLNASTAGFAPGTYSVVATYSGDSKDVSSTSTPLSVVITAASKLTLAASPNPVAKGSITTLTATLTNGQGAPVTSGTITFSYSGGTLGTAQLNSSGVAQLPIGTSAFAQGTYTMQASYPGSSSVPAAKGTVSLVVN